MNKPIGIFDSGVGGLTVVKEMMKTLPHEEIIYFGDTARVPYGSKSKELITEYAIEIMHFLEKYHIKAAIIACNTASSHAHATLKETFSVPIFEVISPGAKAALKISKKKKIGVIGTEGTMKSDAYGKTIHALAPNAMVFSKACPLFVPLVEEGWNNHTVTKSVAEIYLTSLKDELIDTLILGCTHYPLLEKTIKELMKPIHIINPAVHTVLEVKEFLSSTSLLSTNKHPQHQFFVSDNNEKFDLISRIILGDVTDNIQASEIRM